MQKMKTKPRELCEMQLPSGPVVGLFQMGATFYTEQRLPHGETLVVEITDPSAAYEWYLLATDCGQCVAAFPEPLPELPGPGPSDVGSAPLSLPIPAEARRIRLNHGISRRQLAQIAGVSVRTVENWERGRLGEVGPDKQWWEVRYQAVLEKLAAALASVARGEHVPDAAMGRRPSGAAAVADGKRRCSHPGCDALLSRFNDDDRCALHG